MDYLEQQFVGLVRETAVLTIGLTALMVLFGLGMLYLGISLVHSSWRMRRLANVMKASFPDEPEVPPAEYIDPVPEFRNGVTTADDDLIELTVSFNGSALRMQKEAMDDGQPTRHLMHLVTAVVPTAELLTGNVRYAISVRVPANTEQLLKQRLAADCNIAQSATVEFFAN